MYCWHSTPGYCKVGTMEGNGDVNGTYVYLGFKPAYVWTWSIDSSSNRLQYDSQRPGYNVNNETLLSDTVSAEVATNSIDLLSNGFKSRVAADPNIAETHVYVAFAEFPFGGSTVSQARAT